MELYVLKDSDNNIIGVTKTKEEANQVVDVCYLNYGKNLTVDLVRIPSLTEYQWLIYVKTIFHTYKPTINDYISKINLFNNNNKYIKKYFNNLLNTNETIKDFIDTKNLSKVTKKTVKLTQ